MKVWRRTVIAQFCNGVCGKRMAKGDPVLELHIEGLARVARRCAACAGEPVPDELPTVTPRPSLSPFPFHRFTAASTPFDYKAAQAGREPGED